MSLIAPIVRQITIRTKPDVITIRVSIKPTKITMLSNKIDIALLNRCS
jgi:hypothetical protein